MTVKEDEVYLWHKCVCFPACSFYSHSILTAKHFCLPSLIYYLNKHYTRACHSVYINEWCLILSLRLSIIGFCSAEVVTAAATAAYQTQHLLKSGFK